MNLREKIVAAYWIGFSDSDAIVDDIIRIATEHFQDVALNLVFVIEYQKHRIAFLDLEVLLFENYFDRPAREFIDKNRRD
jgi:hypothetical protein